LGKLIDETTIKTYEFCLKVSSSLHFITVPDLELTLIADCSTALSKVSSQVPTIEQMFNKTSELKLLFGVYDIVINKEIINCPITSFIIKSNGC